MSMTQDLRAIAEAYGKSMTEVAAVALDLADADEDGRDWEATS